MSFRLIDPAHDANQDVKNTNLVLDAYNLISKFDGGMSTRELALGPSMAGTAQHRYSNGYDPTGSQFALPDTSYMGESGVAVEPTFHQPEKAFMGADPFDFSNYTGFQESGVDGIGMTHSVAGHGYSFPVVDRLDQVESLSPEGASWLSNQTFRKDMQTRHTLGENVSATNRAEEMYKHLKGWVAQKRIPPTRITPEDLCEYLKLWKVDDKKAWNIMTDVGMRSEMAVETNQIDNLLLEVANQYNDIIATEEVVRAGGISRDPVTRLMEFFKAMPPAEQNKVAAEISKHFERG